MNLKKSGKVLWIVAAVAMLAMVLQGCGGDDGVNPTTHNDLQSEYDALKARYDAAVAQIGAMDDAADMDGSLYAQIAYHMAAASTATTQANNLMMQIGAMDDAADMDGSLYAQIAYHMAAANTATTQANNLMMQIGAMDDAADMDGSLYAQINHYMAQVNDLMTQIGSMDDAADMDGSLRAQIAYHMAQANDLMTQIGSMDDAADMGGSLYAQIAYHMAAANTANTDANDLRMQIGSMDDAADMDGSLYAQIAYHMAQASTANTDADNLRKQIGSADDAPDNGKDASLHAQLNWANARIAALEGGTASDVLDPIKQAASDAVTAADNAATAADEAADAAEMAAENRATIQTGDANSVADAYMARMQANAAADAAEDARTHSDLAQAAMNVADATPHKDQAEDARDDAIDARDMAVEAQGEAEADAMVELKIDGSTKSVGDTSITVNRQSRTSADGRTITGLLSNMDITQAGMRDAMGHSIMAPTSATDSTLIPVTSGGNALVADTVDIGVTYDSAADDARLTLIHSYLGSKKEMLFIRNGDTTVTLDGPTPAPTSPFSAAPATTNITPEEPDAADAVDVIPTGSVVVPYADANAALGLPTSGDGSLAVPTTGATATRTDTGVAGMPRMAGVIARAFDETEGTQPSLYYIDTGVTDVSVGADDDGIDQTRIFLERRVTQNVVTYDVVFVRQVTLDNAMAFEHIHYGLWNGISGRDANTVSELGIGFVTALADGGGMTAAGDMPNVGTLTYNGNWVANVQRAAPRGNGEISRQDGSATIMANVEDNEVDVTLAGLATLEGMIDGNTFSGTKATLVDSDTTTANVIDANYGLDGTGRFEGSFSGGFFGPRAAEAGGVFDFSTEDNHEGAFRGSFGGARD